MKQIFPFWPGASDLKKVLINPDAYSLKRTQKSVQKEMAAWYHCKEKELLGIGRATKTGMPAEQAANTIAQKIKGKEITKLEIAKGAFSREFDNLLVEYSRTTLEATERVLGFFQNCFRFLIDQDPEAINTCRKKEERKDCYRLAVGILARKMRKPSFTFANGASIFLRHIFRQECISLRRHLGGKQAGFEYTGMRYTDILPAETATNLVPPVTLLKDDLMKVRAIHPRCFDIFFNVVTLGYSYKELEGKFGKTAKALTNEAYRCREKLMHAFLNLTK